MPKYASRPSTMPIGHGIEATISIPLFLPRHGLLLHPKGARKRGAQRLAS
jgi:hypothetical protein